MGNLETGPVALPIAVERLARDLLPGRRAVLGSGGPAVIRTLPNRNRRMVGAWCFSDHIGPLDVSTGPGVRVPPHPHTGLQTVTWLLSGQVLHQDSIGTIQVVQPGQLNVMTAGRGVAHCEESLSQRDPVLHGVQLWVALPAVARDTAPVFEHNSRLPRLQDGGVGVTVLMGELAGLRSPATVFSPLVGAQITLDVGTTAQLPLEAGFEHAVLVLAGEAEVDQMPVCPGPLLYLGGGRDGLTVRSDEGATLLLIGGEPYQERLVMWWNLIGVDHDAIVAARRDWMDGHRFGIVPGFDGGPLPAPEMPSTPLRPRGRVR